MQLEAKKISYDIIVRDIYEKFWNKTKRYSKKIHVKNGNKWNDSWNCNKIYIEKNVKNKIAYEIIVKTYVENVTFNFL